MALLAAFLALKGIPSDIVCYRKFLTEQDRAAMLPFYDFVGVTDKATPHLCDGLRPGQ